MKIAWLSDWDAWGNGKGYTVHNSAMKKQAERLGAQFIEPVEAMTGGYIAVDIIVPTTYKPLPGAFNVLFTMYEMHDIPEDWKSKIKQADLVITPCKHNQRIFQQYTSAPVDVCPEGVDPAVYRYFDRKPPREKEFFNFLWVGASNPRKGYELICGAWEVWLRTQPDQIIERTRMIMKTTKADGDESVKSMFNMVIDNRRLPLEELIGLYRASHAFLLPSMGEGWGLTLTEAQATGLPCIYTPWSGPADFMREDFAYPLRFKMSPMQATAIQPDGTQKPYHRGMVAKADIRHIVRRMEQIYHDYPEALRRGKRGAEYIAKNFTWDKAGERFMEILDHRYREWKRKGEKAA